MPDMRKRAWEPGMLADRRAVLNNLDPMGVQESNVLPDSESGRGNIPAAG